MMEPLNDSPKGGQEVSTSVTVSAPLRGWNTRDPLANMRADYAITLDNWLPGTGTVSVRPGAQYWATAFLARVKTTMAWNGLTSSKLFGVTDAGIYDATAGGAIGALVQARTNGYMCHINFNTTGGSYLVTVNGTDDLAYTNGSTWITIANFTISAGGTVNTNQLWNINAFKRSIYFIKKNSMSFFFLPIDSITGTVSEFPLGGLFTKGGKLMAMGTWTVDGATGQEDYSVFITSKGQAAVYYGTDPSSSTTWTLKGVFNLSPPLGRKCFCSYGGDLLILTVRGLFSMTAILKETKLDPQGALSSVIGEAFIASAHALPDAEGWEVVEYPQYSVLVCNIPTASSGASSVQYVMNTQTNAWCRFLGWDVGGFCFYENVLYGGLASAIGKFFQPANDFGSGIICNAKVAFNYYKPRSRLKDWKLLRANLTIGGVCAVNLALDTDFGNDATFGAAVFNTAVTSRWDVSRWDSAQWSTEPVMHVEWVTVDAETSYCSAICLRAIANNCTVDWSATDVIYEVGALLG
jgi:hypothetical protein